MNKKKQIKEVPENKVFVGSLLLQSEPFEFTPHKLLDKIKYPKENRPIFQLQPLNAKDRHWMDADAKRMSADGMLWAKKEGIEIGDDSNFMLLLNKWAEFSNQDERKEIIRKSIIGFKCEKEELLGKFKKDKEGGLDKKIFEKFPNELINVIDAELNNKASLSNSELLGL